jgi:hypothetical protein
MRRIWIALAVALTLAVPIAAHDGHDERVLGTVAAVDATSIALTTKEGKTVRVALDDKTVVLRGERTVTRADIAVGERAAVSVASRKNVHVATEIRLAEKKKD